MQTINEPIEGITPEYMAVRTGSAAYAHIEVLDSEGDPLFSVPADWTAEQVNTAISVHQRGFKAGAKSGKVRLQIELRQLLGCMN